MKKIFLVITASILFAGQVLATNLLQVYNQSLTNDPTFKAAKAQWLSDQENIPISRGALLPQFDLQANFTHSTNSNSPKWNKPNNAQVYTLSIDQSLFNLQAWATLAQAHASVKASAATYAGAAQNLISRVANAYFAVLTAKDKLRYTVAKKRSINKQLARTKQRYQVGLVAITDVYQAQANYDSTSAQEISDRNNLANQKESLREITGDHYKNFATLVGAVPLIKPKPENINVWVNLALKQNYSLKAARYNLQATHENIRINDFDRYPTVTASAQARYTENSNTQVGFKKTKYAGLGVLMDFPFVKGGTVIAKTNQAIYDYRKASADLEATRRSVTSKTRQDYLGVVADISKVKADRQAVVSARSSLKATEAGYTVGTQTMVDVLDQQTNLYNAQTQLSADQYDFILKTLALKYDAGVLSTSDLEQITVWLLRPHRVTRVTKARVTTKKRVKRKVVKRKRSHLLSNIEKQVLKFNPHHYTLQLIADQHKKQIVAFVNRHKISGKTYCISTKKNGKRWYKLIVGNYPTHHAAEVAAKRMFVKTKIKPWVRRFADIQKHL